jgi:hypothetical protein
MDGEIIVCRPLERAGLLKWVCASIASKSGSARKLGPDINIEPASVTLAFTTVRRVTFRVPEIIILVILEEASSGISENVMI